MSVAIPRKDGGGAPDGIILSLVSEYREARLRGDYETAKKVQRLLRKEHGVAVARTPGGIAWKYKRRSRE